MGQNVVTNELRIRKKAICDVLQNLGKIVVEIFVYNIL